jgi:uncharacterized protein involved in response to NO
MDPSSIARLREDSRRVFAAPHRFFFLSGVVALLLASGWWACVLAARAWPALPAPGSSIPDSSLHAFLMLFGFAPFFMFGFVFTAGPRWLDVAAPPPSAWLRPGILAIASVVALFPLQLAGSPAGAAAIRIAAALYATGFIWILIEFLRLVRSSRAPDKVHARLVLAALSAGASCVAAFAWLGTEAYTWIRDVGLWLFLLPVFVIVCHRMIPFFTASAIPFVTAFRPWWLLFAMLGAPLLHGLLGAAGQEAFTWLVDLPAAALLLWVTVRWGFAQSLSNRLLAMLHVGFVWYGLGFLLEGAHSLALLAGGSGLPFAALHAFTIGFAASLLMAMVTRVTCGHSGRTLAADALTWRLFMLLQVVAVARVATALWPAPGVLAAVALLWAAVFVRWGVKYAPVYWRARADGRQG